MVDMQNFLFKVYILKYFNQNINNTTKISTKEIEKKDNIKFVEEESTPSTLINLKTKINNCFVEAKKLYKKEYEEKFKAEILKNNDKKIISLLQKEIKMASPNTIIYSCLSKEKKIFNKDLSEIETTFSKILGTKMNIVFLEDVEWEEETTKYIENKKKGILPKYINETEKKEDNKTLIFEQILEIE